jgi:hypothetical protein
MRAASLAPGGRGLVVGAGGFSAAVDRGTLVAPEPGRAVPPAS